MTERRNPSNLGELLDLLKDARSEDGRISWHGVMDAVGSRSFGPLLLTGGLVISAPVIGDIPGVPIMIGIFLVLIVVQLLLGRKHFWLPDFLLNRTVDEDKLHKTLDWLKKPARFIDRLIKPRLSFLIEGVMSRVIAFICLGISLMLPAMELVPFSANVAGAALTGFGLALIARDGVLALIALASTGAIIAILVAAFF